MLLLILLQVFFFLACVAAAFLRLGTRFELPASSSIRLCGLLVNTVAPL